jgi:hypothetical protein
MTKQIDELMKELDKSLVVNAFGDVYYNFTSE